MLNRENTDVIDVSALARLGGGEIAYVKPMTSDDIQRAFPQSPELEPGRLFFALLHADGSPILLTDSAEAARANAIANDLTPVSLH